MNCGSDRAGLDAHDARHRSAATTARENVFGMRFPYFHDAHKMMTINAGIDATRYRKPMPAALAIVIGQLPPNTARNDFSA